MRLGVYLGRHGSFGGGMAVYSREYVRELLSVFEESSFEEDDVVLYGDRSVFSNEMLDDISLSPVLSVVTEASLLMLPAGSYLRRLPNGARVRVVIRILPEWVGRRAGYLLDQLVVGLLARLDRVELLHCTMNFGILSFGRSQFVTVHDLFQAFAPHAVQGGCKRLFQAYYRLLYTLQFRRVEHVICDCKRVSAEVADRFSFDPVRMTVVELGLDRTLMQFIETKHRDRTRVEQLEHAWLGKQGLDRGYQLILASADPRKNLERTLNGWLRANADSSNRRLVIVCGANDLRKQCEKLLGEREVTFISPLEREEMPLLFSCASLVILPTLAEGFGLPALEAHACGSLVVTGPLEHCAGVQSETVFICDPLSEESIARAISNAMELQANREGEAGKVPSVTARQERISDKQWERFSAKWPTMKCAVRKTVALYRQALLRVS